MKRRINLLSITFSKRKLSEVVGDVRSKALIAMIVFIVLAIGEAVGYSYVNNKLSQFQNSKTTLDEFLQSNSEIDSGIKFFIYKYNLLNKYLEEDANSYFYYQKVVGILQEFAPTGTLKLFSFNNTGEASFSVGFTSYDEASELLTSVETPEFLDYFEYVKVEGFDAAPKVNQKEFVVNITAKIIQEDETESQSN